MSNKNISLNTNQELAILEEWNKRGDDPPYVKELIALVFPDVPEEMKDGRSKYGRAVKKFLAEKSLEAKVTNKYYPKEKLIIIDSEWFKAVKNKKQLWLKSTHNFTEKLKTAR